MCQDAINDCATKSVDYRTTMNYAAKLFQKLHICWGEKSSMKKSLISTICFLFLLTSVGCSNGEQPQSTDNKPKNSKIQKHKSNHKSGKKHSKTKVADKKKKRENNNNKQQASEQTNDQQSATSQNQQQSQPQNNQTTQQQDPNGISYDTNTLTGFLNTYGMSPVAYKIKNGMSAYNALKSTPDIMKTSGEMQTEHAMDQGYVDHNGNDIQQPTQNNQDQSDSYDTQDDGY